LLLLISSLPYPVSSSSGLLVVGGGGGWDSAEFWPPTISCQPPPLPRTLDTPSLGLLGDQVLACYGDSCDQLTKSGWLENSHQLLHSRRYHTSTNTSHGLLLVGGQNSAHTSELLTESGGLEGFSPKHGPSQHCTIQVEEDSVVVTGGGASPNGVKAFVTQYSGLQEGQKVTSKELEPLQSARHRHACGSYRVGETQMLIVTGGNDGQVDLDSTEVLDFNHGSWRYAQSLPAATFGLTGTLLDGVFHVTGGWQGLGRTDEILAWDAVAEVWTLVGNLETPRNDHAVMELPLQVMEGFCSVKTNFLHR